MSEDPDFTKMNAQEAFRLTCADYLRMLAGLIEKGSVTSFALTWTEDAPKPEGKLLTNALAFVSSAEATMLQQLQKERERIQVQDLTDALKNHEPCPKDKQAECPFCSVRLS